MCVRKENLFFMCFLLYLILISYYYRNTNFLIFSTIFYFSGSVVCCVIFNWDENNNNNDEILIIENIIQENMIEENQNKDFSYIELTAEETKNIPDSFECCICLEEKNILHNENNQNNESKTKLIKLSCNHIFHEKCIKKWLEKDSTCPLCRFDL